MCGDTLAPQAGHNNMQRLRPKRYILPPICIQRCLSMKPLRIDLSVPSFILLAIKHARDMTRETEKRTYHQLTPSLSVLWMYIIILGILSIP